MLGRKTFTKDELASARALVDDQLTAYRNVVEAVAGAAGKKARPALDELEVQQFNGATLAFDRFFVHRVRMVTGKDGTPLNELELLAESLMADGVLKGSTVIKYVPDDAVLGLQVGDRIRITADGFERLADAVLAELEVRFLER